MGASLVGCCLLITVADPQFTTAHPHSACSASAYFLVTLLSRIYLSSLLIMRSVLGLTVSFLAAVGSCRSIARQNAGKPM